MRRFVAAAGLAVAAFLLAGCGGSHGRAMPGTIYEPTPASLPAAVHVARATNAELFAIFPAKPGGRHCTISFAAGVSVRKLPATCRTKVVFRTSLEPPVPPLIVVFTERWAGCSTSGSCTVPVRRMQHTWRVFESPSGSTALRTRSTGDPAPQERGRKTA